MDKAKEYLAVLQKHHFWVICGVVLLASLVSWYLAESSLDKEFKAQKDLVEGKFTALNGIANTPDHPNDKVTEELRKKVLGIADNVYGAWQLRYNEQQKVPQWAGDLSKPFLDFVNSPSRAPDAAIPARFREEYMNFIRKEIDSLFTQVNARDLVEIAGSTVVAGPGVTRQQPGRPQPGGTGAANLGVTHEWKGIVAWDEAQREALRAQYDWNTPPTSQQVRYANEDLWIYRALLDIIVQTNKEAKEHLVAPIKQIDALNIGQLVQPPAQFITLAVPAAAGGGEGAMAMQPGAEGGEGMAPPQAPGAGGGEGGGTEGAAALDPEQLTNAQLKHLRYVDAKGKPLGYNSPEPFAEFKIMPFEMRLLMDQRKIPEFLANCANSPLPVEVRQVGIVSTETPLTAASGGGGEGGGMRGNMPGGNMPGGNMPRGLPGGRMGGEGGMPGGPMARPATRPNPRGGEGGGGAVGGGNDLGGAVELRPYDLHVDVRGVIYIFNKPDRAKVGKAAPAPEAAAAPAEAGAGG